MINGREGKEPFEELSMLNFFFFGLSLPERVLLRALPSDSPLKINVNIERCDLDERKEIRKERRTEGGRRE